MFFDILAPVFAGTVRLLLIAAGGWWLTASHAPAWSLFVLVGASMTAFGLCASPLPSTDAVGYPPDAVAGRAAGTKSLGNSTPRQVPATSIC
jgi:hypothetical protein